MNTEQPTGHSEDYFSEYRDFWWNQDFLELMAKRLRLGECASLLDVGCGQCHWSRLLVPFLKHPAEITAFDSDPKWSAGSDELVKLFETAGAVISFEQGDAMSLPFGDNTFDIATCQTVLIHLQEPKKAIREMLRVVKPGGLVLCVEPNNIMGNLVKNSNSASDSIEDTLTGIKYALMLERGKVAAGEGDNSYGDLLAGAYSEIGFDDIRVYLSDKAMPLIIPYETPEQKAVLAGLEDWHRNESGIQDWAEKRRFLEALDDKAADSLEVIKRFYETETIELLDAVRCGTYHSGGGAMMYLVSGRKSLTKSSMSSSGLSRLKY